MLSFGELEKSCDIFFAIELDLAHVYLKLADIIWPEKY